MLSTRGYRLLAGPGSDDETYSVVSDGGTVYGASPPRPSPSRSFSARLRAALGVRGASNPAIALYEPLAGLGSGALSDSAAGSPATCASGRAAGPQWFSLNHLVT